MSNNYTKDNIVKKMVEVEKILYNESKSSRIDENFNIKQENRKFRKTLDYIGRIKTNNYLDPSILLREETNEDDGDYYFVCVEGAVRVKAIKNNPKIKYLKCSVANAEVGKNEIKPSRVRNEERQSYRAKPVEITFDAPESVKKQYSKKLNLSKSKLPTMGISNKK